MRGSAWSRRCICDAPATTDPGRHRDRRQPGAQPGLIVELVVRTVEVEVVQKDHGRTSGGLEVLHVRLRRLAQRGTAGSSFRRMSTFDRHLSRYQPPQDHFERQDVGLVLAHYPERAQSIAPENMKSESARSSSR